MAALVGTNATLGFEVMTDILLIVVPGSIGTMYGAVVATLLIQAQHYRGRRTAAAKEVPLLAADGDRLDPRPWLGLWFILPI